MRKSFDLNLNETNSNSSAEIECVVVNRENYVRNKLVAFIDEYESYDELIIIYAGK